MRGDNMKTDHELLELLRNYARNGRQGKMGRECMVEKDFLIEVADRLEALAFAPTDDDYEPITHFFED